MVRKSEKAAKVERAEKMEWRNIVTLSEAKGPKPLSRQESLGRHGIASLYSRPYGQVAQLVEQRTENPRVGGSIPSLATNYTSPLL